MKNRNIHIISFNVPYPPNYGGIIDVYYKLKALYNLGVQIHLHCFDYGRGAQAELEKICTRVYYYKRQTGLLKALHRLPYIVNSRSHKELLKNLLADTYPILFEGLHSTFYITDKALQQRLKIVRTHNVEHSYYKYLARQEHNILKKFYYSTASKKLRNYEPVLHKASIIAAISPNDYTHFSSLYQKTFWLPPFHPDREITVALGLGSYVLYHGNLSVVENIKAAMYLMDIFKEDDSVQLIVAGKNPDKVLLKRTQAAKNIQIVSNPSDSEMQHLITHAQVHLLPTFQATGIKLKLIASLHRGRHCIVNNDMVAGTGLEQLCHRANTPTEFLEKTRRLLQIPFENKDLILRKEILGKKFDNQRNAELLIEKIFDGSGRDME